MDDQIFFGPHDAHWIPDSLIDGGKIMVFNNLAGSNSSALNIFTPPMNVNGDFPDPGSNAHGPTAVDWNYEEPGFYSSTISGVQRLPNGNTLVCEGAGGHLFELSQAEIKVWDYVNPSSVSGNYTQGINPAQNSMFRAYRYPVDYPAFIDKDLTPSSLIEIDSDPQPCDIELEPLGMAFFDTFVEVNIAISNDELSIKGLDDVPSVSAEIYDINGRTRHTFQVRNGEHLVDLNGWPSGIYILTLKSDEYHRAFKFYYK
jgi:hypothetical protein